MTMIKKFATNLIHQSLQTKLQKTPEKLNKQNLQKRDSQRIAKRTYKSSIADLLRI